MLLKRLATMGLEEKEEEKRKSDKEEEKQEWKGESGEDKQNTISSFTLLLSLLPSSLIFFSFLFFVFLFFCFFSFFLLLFFLLCATFIAVSHFYISSWSWLVYLILLTLWIGNSSARPCYLRGLMLWERPNFQVGYPTFTTVITRDTTTLRSTLNGSYS